MLIYKITNRMNDKVYIGQYAGDLAKSRLRQHIREANRGSQRFLCKAIRKYGVEAFSVEVIHQARTKQELDGMETFFIVLHQSHVPANGYNMTLGGEGSFGWSPSKETRKLWSKQRSGQPVTEQQLANLALGQHRIRTKKIKIAKSVEGKKVAMRAAWTPERRAAQAERIRLRNVGNSWHKGHSLSLESRRKISKTKKEKAASAAA